MSPSDRLPPQHIEAEQCLLGSLLLDNLQIDSVVGLVKPNDFYRDAHGQIYRVILDLWQKTEEANVILIADHVGPAAYDDLGGDDYFTTLVDSVPHAANAESFANIVKEKSIARSLVELHTEALRDAYSNELDAYGLLEKSEQRIAAVADRQVAGDVFTAADVIAQTMAGLKRIEDGDPLGISTGFADMDDMLGGFLPGQLVVIAARPSIGKTALATAIAAKTAAAGKRVLIVSLEMGPSELGQRLISYFSGVSSSTLRDPGFWSKDDRLAIAKAADLVARLPILFDHTAARTVNEIAACARQWQRKGGLDLLIVDQLNLVSPGETVKIDNRQEVVAKISRSLKSTARQLGVPILATHQLNRQIEARTTKVPVLADLRESGQIEADADVALLLHRPEFYNPSERSGEAEVHVAKNRNGATGVVRLAFKKDLMRFDSYSSKTSSY
jgi:replicative DNA helicase